MDAFVQQPFLIGKHWSEWSVLVPLVHCRQNIVATSFLYSFFLIHLIVYVWFLIHYVCNYRFFAQSNLCKQLVKIGDDNMFMNKDLGISIWLNDVKIIWWTIMHVKGLVILKHNPAFVFTFYIAKDKMQRLAAR